MTGTGLRPGPGSRGLGARAVPPVICGEVARWRNPQSRQWSAQLTVAFDDVALYFLEQVWDILEKWQKEMYQQEMKTNYETLDSLGCAFSKPNLITWMEQGRMLFIRDQERLEKTRVTLRPSAGQQLDLNTGTSLCVGDQGTPGAKEEECHLNDLQEQGSCAPSSKEERKISSDQRASLKHPSLQETEMLNKNLDATASNQDQNDPRPKLTRAPGHLEIPPGPRLYSCFVCRKVFQIKRDLVKHKRNHSKSQPCKDPKQETKSQGNAELGMDPAILCKQQHFQGGRFKESRFLKRSLVTRQTVDMGQRPFQCPKCDKAFQDRATLRSTCCGQSSSRPAAVRAHERTHIAQQPFSCDQCERRFSHKARLTDHVRVHTGEKPFQCPECQKSFRLNRSLKAHRFQHSGQKPFGCPECERRFCWRNALRAHQRLHGQEKPFSCGDCGRSFTRPSKLARHRRVHDRRTRPGLPAARALAEHRRLHGGARPFRCPECDKSFFWKASLKVHQRRHRGELPFACGECGKAFAQPSQLTEHARIHSGERPFPCPECDRRFRLKGNLKSHLLQHRGDKPFSCAKCGKSFTQQYRLREHARVHSGEKPFQCPHCGKSYCIRGSLKVHLHTHRAEKPFGCPECGKGFLQKRSLKMHLRHHQGERPFPCAECGRSFTYLGALNTHLAVHARGKPCGP
ncbi:Zinc finger protein 425 [Camelus dromedarius]|uniref:Zinc finger protein 425 n=1 Tax=Camelus dromedarius TaxID=9838 RepID=A0A5N4DZW2_CAMDR|nr:Zinc finger protein 425 [Camelus dromedarius]